jgi:anti-sigma B factor antagonist
MENATVTITIEDAPSVPNLKIITIGGSLDAVNAEQIDVKVLPVMEQERTNIILDISKLDYLSSIGMLCLIKYFTIMTNQKRLVKFIKPPKFVFNSLEAAGIAKYFDMYDSIEAAISSF